MTDFTTDLIAWLILGSLWLFGGAALFDNHNTKYKDVLAGWSFLQVLVVFAGIIAYAAYWALIRLFT